MQTTAQQLSRHQRYHLVFIISANRRTSHIITSYHILVFSTLRPYSVPENFCDDQEALCSIETLPGPVVVVVELAAVLGALFRTHKVTRPKSSQLGYALPTRIGLAFYTQNTEFLGVCPNILSTNRLKLEFVLPLLRRVQRASMWHSASCYGTSCESTCYR